MDGNRSGEHPTFLNHVKLTVNDFEESREFYSKLFDFLGVGLSFRITEEDDSYESWGGKVIAWGAGDGFDLEIQEKGESSEKFDRKSVGLDHISFDAPSKEAVDEFYNSFLIENSIESDPPREYPEYHPGYYAVFFRDPNGILLEYAYLGE